MSFIINPLSQARVKRRPDHFSFSLFSSFYCYINYLGDVSEVHSNVEDLVEYTFEVILIQEKIEDFKGREDAETTTEGRSYDINEAFRADNDIGLGDILRVTPIETIKSYVEGNTRIQLKIILKVQTLETIAL